jgi:hypothetical protein
MENFLWVSVKAQALERAAHAKVTQGELGKYPTEKQAATMGTGAAGGQDTLLGEV